jgi:NADPH:quinone reductase-like Zn-dependent oxidoreductase
VKAVVWTAYGPPDVLEIQEVEKPVPRDNEVLIKVRATTVTAGDCEQRSLKLPIWFSIPIRAYVGMVKPSRITVLGMELAGEVESAGKDVKLFKKGDQVFASTGLRFGSYAEYKCLPEDSIMAIKPSNMTFEEAAAVPMGGLEALYYVRKADIRSGQKVLINGAGGTIGTFAVQLAKHFGAIVTGVDTADKLDMLSSIGADLVIDYLQEDFTTNRIAYDVIFDVVGKSPLLGSVKSLKESGCYLTANPKPLHMVLGKWAATTSNKKVVLGGARSKTEDLLFIKDIIETGKLKSVVDRTYPLEQIVEAHKYVESGHKKGHVVITL